MLRSFEENTCILSICMYFVLYPILGVTDTFGIHVRFIKIHVYWALPWCHTGYISGYIEIHAGYMYLQIGNQDTCGIHMRYIGKHEWIHVSQMPPERDVSEMQSGYIFGETCGIHAGYMYKYHILKGNQDPSGYMQDAHEIHEEDVRDTYLWNLGGRIHHRDAR